MATISDFFDMEPPKSSSGLQQKQPDQKNISAPNSPLDGSNSDWHSQPVSERIERRKTYTKHYVKTDAEIQREKSELLRSRQSMRAPNPRRIQTDHGLKRGPTSPASPTSTSASGGSNKFRNVARSITGLFSRKRRSPPAAGSQ